MENSLGFILNIDGAEISSWISRYLWPFTRIAGFFMVLPLFGTRLVTQRVRLYLALFTTLVITPVLPPMPVIEALSLQTMIIIAQQLLIGVALAFVLEILMNVFIMSGQMVAMQTGLGMAMMVDPSNGVNVAVVAQWFLIFVNLLFLSLNGHLVAIEIMADSFFTMPVGVGTLSTNTLYEIARIAQWMFSAALVLALPAVSAMLVVNIAFGVMARLAPQLNIFAVGFPVTMMLGLIVLWITFSGYGDKFSGLMTEIFQFMRSYSL
ncbi:MAG: flagellar biosynthetic protein FliR [Gammaproteobacteria bacterium]|nr:flagellar biosynthetic protein FliR [Gammaproteobacteria bacterium]